MNKFNLLLLAAALAPLSAQATVNYSWSFTTWNETNYGSQGSFAGSSGAGSVTVSAFSTTADYSGGIDRFEAGTLGSWSGGIGVSSAEDGAFGSSPNHAFDNDGNTTDEKPAGDVDAAVFAFNQSISLTSLSLGWIYNDADVSVLAYTGNTGTMSNPEDITGKTFTELLSSGWEFVGNYMNVQNELNDTATITTDKSSSYWLVSAYTSCANNGCDSYDSNFGNDYFKISSLGAKTTSGGGGGGGNNGVPEPSSLLLLAGGLLGWRLNRYHRAQPQTEECMAA